MYVQLDVENAKDRLAPVYKAKLETKVKSITTLAYITVSVLLTCSTYFDFKQLGESSNANTKTDYFFHNYVFAFKRVCLTYLKSCEAAFTLFR